MVSNNALDHLATVPAPGAVIGNRLPISLLALFKKGKNELFNFDTIFWSCFFAISQWLQGIMLIMVRTNREFILTKIFPCLESYSQINLCLFLNAYVTFPLKQHCVWHKK